jgi:hypothetical protein
VERRFDAIVLVPISLVLGLALGVSIVTNEVPVELISQTTMALLGLYIAIIVLELLIRTVIDGVMKVLYYEPDTEPAEGAPGELTVLLIRNGEAVGQLRSWDKPIERGKREYWAKKLGRIFTKNGKQQVVEPGATIP